MLRDYKVDFETVGKLSVGDQIRTTDTRFGNIFEYEAYINPIDERYDAEDAIFNGYFFKIKTLQFNRKNRSQNGNGCDFKHEIIEYRGNICYIPTKGYCFTKCDIFSTGGDCKEQYLDFTRKD